MFLTNDKDPAPGLLRYELLPGEPVDEFTLAVLQQNPPDGVLPLGRERTEAYDHLLLPISHVDRLTSAGKIVKNYVTPDEFMKHVFEVYASLPNHLIRQDGLVLRPEWTFMDCETGMPVLLVLPTPLAKDLSLPFEEYELLVRHALEQREQIAEENEKKEESAKKSAKGEAPAKPFRKRVLEFWENLD